MNKLQNWWNRLTAPQAVDQDEARREYMTRVILLMIGVVMWPVTLVFLAGWIFGAVPLDMPVVTALVSLLPSGLIINELVSNALKYAFPPDWDGANGQSARICIDFWPSAEGVCTLIIQDNGVGFPKDVAARYQAGGVLQISGARSLGLRLVDSLVNQLNGKLTLALDGGVKYTMIFQMT